MYSNLIRSSSLLRTLQAILMLIEKLYLHSPINDNMKRRKFIQLGTAGSVLSLPAAYAEKRRIFQRDTVQEPAREVSIAGSYDVVVSGAGPAGVSAAIEAGRNGAKVLLLEAQGCLGGVWTAGLLTWILDQSNKPGLMREIETKLVERDGVSRDIDTGGVLSFDAEIMKLLLEELCLDAKVDILFHARVVAAVKNNRKTSYSYPDRV